MMRARAALALAMLLSVGCTGLVNGMSTEELIFEEPPYIEAAKAVVQGDVTTLERLIKRGLDVNHEGKETKTPWGRDTVTLLLWATLSESMKGAETLLKAGADPNKATRRGMTSLIMASGMKNDDLFELLLVRYKADPNKIYDGSIKTALIAVLRQQRWDRAEILTKYGADVNLDMDRGETASI